MTASKNHNSKPEPKKPVKDVAEEILIYSALAFFFLSSLGVVKYLIFE